MQKRINQVDIKDVIKCDESEMEFDVNVSISKDYIKSDIARKYIKEIRSKLTKLGYTVGLCTLSRYGDRGMYTSNFINNVSFTLLYYSL